LLIGRAPGVLRLERLETRPALVRAARPNGPSTEEVTHRERQLPERPHGPDLGAPRRQREGAAKQRDHKRGCQECRGENGHRSEGAESFRERAPSGGEREVNEGARGGSESE